ncbi:MAG: cytochrome c3 family protein [Variibacter sp.]
MTQIFSPAADTWLRLFLVSLAAMAAGSVVFAVGMARSDWYTDTRMHPAAQPVPFSHKHHAGQLGIDCRYCHASVAEGPHAGLPPTHTCMTCHSQVWTTAPMLAPVRASLADKTPLDWHRVARVPDYVYFRHDIHVAKGVGCVECHGRVDTMALTYRAVPLTMQFCLDCHRDPAPRLRPKSEITSMTWTPKEAAAARELGHRLMRAYGIRTGDITHCNVCHR